VLPNVTQENHFSDKAWLKKKKKIGPLGGSVGLSTAFGSGHDPGDPGSARVLLLPLTLPPLVLYLSHSLSK